MCGFTGFVLADPAGLPDGGLLRRMTRTLEHRGPDDEGRVVRGPLALGFRRLSIIDLEGGHQPLETDDGRVLLVGNGEIYNFRELRAELQAEGVRFRTGSDMETVLHLYLREGAACVERLEGMFALALIDLRDPARPRVLLVRDRLGIKPLFWGLRDGTLFFGSEPKALLASDRFPRELRGGALLEFLQRSFVGGTRSAWAGIERLAPATRLSWSPGQDPRLERYWDLPLDGPRPPATDAEVLEHLDAAVAQRLVADVPLGAFLSGGIDSGAVADSMARARSESPILCSVGFDEAAFDELERARVTAARIGAVHHTEVLRPDPTLALEVLPWFFDEPHGDPSDVPTYLVARMAREHMTVVLSGDGGDEVFGGYRRYVHDLAENRLRSVLGGPGRRLAAAVGQVYPKLDRAPRVLRAQSFLRNLGRDPAAAFWESSCQLSREAALALLDPDLRAALRDEDPFEEFAAHYHAPRHDCPLYRAQYAEFHTVLPEQLLTKVDRATMAVGLEARVPFLDHRFVERFAPLPASEKVRGARGKHRLREALRTRLDPSVLDGPKRGFDVPLAAWLRGPLAPALDEALESLPAEWFDRAVLRARRDEHRAGRRDHGNLLWSLLVLEHWRRRHACTGVAA